MVPVGHPPAPADLLLDELVRCRERITYKAAYLALVGRAPRAWYRNHVTAVVRVVERSRQVVVDGLPIRLDALVVNEKSPNEPSEPHFAGKPYTRTEWQAVFSTWGVRRP